MTSYANPSELLQKLVELERQRGPELPDLARLYSELYNLLAAKPVRDVFALIHSSRDLTDDHGYWCCIRALQARGDQETFDTCAAWARDSSPDRRRAAADILAQLGFHFGTPFKPPSWLLIEPLLGDRDSSVIAAALTACGKLQIGDPAHLAPFAAHSSTNVRYGAVHALSNREDPESIRGLILLSRDQDRDVRNWATFGLGQLTDIDTPDLRAALLERIGDDDPELRAEIRGEALIGLARRGDRRVLEPLRHELAGEFHGAWCIEAAQALADPSLAPMLTDLKRRLDPEDLDVFGDELDRAIAACSPVSS